MHTCEDPAGDGRTASHRQLAAIPAWAFARDEGEGFETVAGAGVPRTVLARPCVHTLVVAERFRIVERL